jgi:hypothetical protein
MGFREFRYLPEALPGILALAHEGVPFEALLERIRAVMATWQPGDDPEAQQIVPFHGHLLVFCVSEHDPQALVLAAVHKQPFP